MLVLCPNSLAMSHTGTSPPKKRAECTIARSGVVNETLNGRIEGVRVADRDHLWTRFVDGGVDKAFQIRKGPSRYRRLAIETMLQLAIETMLQ
jgi:hypothetical protein